MSSTQEIRKTENPQNNLSSVEMPCFLDDDRCDDCPTDFPNKTCSEFGPTLNPNLKQFWLTKADVKIFRGGRSSSKTWDAAGMATHLADSYKTKFLCVRQFQNRISESVYANLKIQIERFDLEKNFDAQKSILYQTRTGSEFHFYGIHRNIAEIKGFEGADVLWIEEGEGLTEEQWRILEPTIKKEGAEIWIVYNPRLQTDFIETSPLFKHDPENGVIVRHINYDENPFLSKTALRRINKLKKADPDEYSYVYLGVPRSNDDSAVIKRTWIESAIDVHIKLGIEPSGSKAIGFDVADDGADLNSQCYKHGIVALWSEHWKGGEDKILKSCSRVYRKALEMGAEINYDSIGVGAAAGNKFSELNDARKEEHNQAGTKGKFIPIQYEKFIAGGEVANPDKFYIDAGGQQITNKEFFCNLKSQSWWLAGDRFRNTYNAIQNDGKFNVETGKVICNNGEKFDVEDLISISSDMPNLANLVTELSTPKRDFSKDGKVKVESKDDLKARDIKSHNDADSFVMAYAPKKPKISSIFS
jgi:phage terminase large subunit